MMAPTDGSGPHPPHDDEPGCGFVEALVRPRDACLIGYRIGGLRPGPTAVVAGYSGTARAIYERLLKLPTLPWMHGTLVLITLDALDPGATDEELTGLIGAVDRTLHLPFATPANHDAAIRDGYWMVLSLCTQLGMISGRGVIAVH